MYAADVVVVIVAVVAAAAVYLIRCRLFPYGPCRSCAGRRGRSVGSTARAWGRCRSCGGTGERLRLGARVFGGRRDA